MSTIQDLPPPWRDVSVTHLNNFFTRSRGRNGLAQIWFGRPTFGTAVSMADSDYTMNTRDVPEFIDDTAENQSQAWFRLQNLDTMACHVPLGLTIVNPSQHDICHILELIIKPAMRAIAISCLRSRWAGSEDVIARHFTAADPELPHQEKLGDWIEEYGFGGVIYRAPFGLRFEPAIMPHFTRASCELETLEWSDPQYPFLPFRRKESEKTRSRRPRLEDFPEILEFMKLDGEGST